MYLEYLKLEGGKVKKLVSNVGQKVKRNIMKKVEKKTIKTFEYLAASKSYARISEKL